MNNIDKNMTCNNRLKTCLQSQSSRPKTKRLFDELSKNRMVVVVSQRVTRYCLYRSWPAAQTSQSVLAPRRITSRVLEIYCWHFKIDTISIYLPSSL